MPGKDVERRFREVDHGLNVLMDSDAHAAIRAARALKPDSLLTQRAIDSIAAGALVDAGIAAADIDAVNDGVDILERLHAENPGKGDFSYCLANGLCAQADLTGSNYPDWYLVTADVRRRARRLYQEAASCASLPARIRAKAHTNLGNSLLRAYRRVEAYDCYERALELDPTNGIARTGAAKALLLLAEFSASPQVLVAAASAHLSKAKADPGKIREVAGEQAYQKLSSLLAAKLLPAQAPDLSAATEYQRFVAKHRISLAPTISGLDLKMSRWDCLGVKSITEHINRGDGVPPLFAMFNVMKSEFLVARHLAYSALNHAPRETGKYSDTLDYAIYGISPAMLTTAQRTCLDLLDKVAIATSEYLGLPGKPSGIYFTKRWFMPRKLEGPLLWQPEVERIIRHRNTALIALSDVSGDIEDGGFLQDKRAMRNSSTHRFTVLHDLGGSASRENAAVSHHHHGTFVNQLIETLQLARAVLLYFVEMVALQEHLTHGDRSRIGVLEVPAHDWIRGQDA